MKFRQLPPVDLVRHILDYDPLTGKFIWVNPPKEHARLAGKPAGSIKEGYLNIKISRRNCLAHRLAWLHHYGSIPNERLDHKNGDKLDNRISNLRIVSAYQNSSNCAKVKGKILPKGVRITNRGKFQARICAQGKLVPLGCYITPEEAFDAYRIAALETFGEFWREE